MLLSSTGFSLCRHDFNPEEQHSLKLCATD